MTLTRLQQDNRKHSYLKLENEPNLGHSNPNRHTPRAVDANHDLALMPAAKGAQILAIL